MGTPLVGENSNPQFSYMVLSSSYVQDFDKLLFPCWRPFCKLCKIYGAKTTVSKTKFDCIPVTWGLPKFWSLGNPYIYIALKKNMQTQPWMQGREVSYAAPSVVTLLNETTTTDILDNCALEWTQPIFSGLGLSGNIISACIPLPTDLWILMLFTKRLSS